MPDETSNRPIKPDTRNTPPNAPDAQRKPLMPPAAMPTFVVEGTANAASPAHEQSPTPGTAPQTQRAAGGSNACGMTGDTPGFPSAKNRAARLATLARGGNAMRKDNPPKQGILTADDYAVALGKPRPDSSAVDYQVASAFAQAWAEDGDVLHYRGNDYCEPNAPPDLTSRAAAGWQPAGGEPAAAIQPQFARVAGEPANRLFEAYGASYVEAYSVALALSFSEDKPVPDDDTGDVTGLVSSILHTPSGTPILLGTVYLEDRPETCDYEAPAPDTTQDAPLSRGRKAARFLLLLLGAGALAVSGLYFTGYLL